MAIQRDLVESWQEFEDAWNDYAVATELSTRTVTEDGNANEAGMRLVAASLCAVMGPDCQRVLINLPGITA